MNWPRIARSTGFAFGLTCLAALACGGVSSAGSSGVLAVVPLPGQDPVGVELIGLDFTSRLPDAWVGEPVRPADHAATLLRFWTDTCPFCEASLPAVEQLRSEHATGGLQTVGVYHPKPPRPVRPAAVVAAARELGYHGPLALDPEWAALHRMWLDGGREAATSASFLLDRRGVVRFVQPGPEFHPSDDPAHASCQAQYVALRAAIETVLAEDASGGGAGDSPAVVLDVYPDVGVHAVEPLAYGVNEGGIAACTLRRHGGNRFTGLDWETAASHAGGDWQHQHDWYLAQEPEARGAGALLALRIGRDREQGARSLVTLQLAGYVAADADGPLSEAEAAPGPRWYAVSLEPTPPGPADWAPDLDDDVVFLDQQVRDLVRRFGRAADGGVLAYALDNEPALWSVTHPRLHPAPATWAEVVDKGIAAARLITTEDPTAQVFGPVLYGWAAYRDLQGAPDAARQRRGQETFTSHFLRRMHAASELAGRRLLHRLDVHWYPEAMGAARVASDAVDPSTAAARVQAPRSLWDAGYREQSWIAEALGGPIRLIPRLKDEIAAAWPGTELALTEYSFGAADHVSGGLAQADALGLFGRHGVAACYWSLGGGQAYVEAAFRLYLEPGHELHPFGDVSVHALAADDARVAVYAARVSDDPDLLSVVVVSRQLDEPLDVVVKLHTGDRPVQSVRGVRFDASSAELHPVHPAPRVTAEGFTDRLPPGAATLYELQLEPRPAR